MKSKQRTLKDWGKMGLSLVLDGEKPSRVRLADRAAHEDLGAERTLITHIGFTSIVIADLRKTYPVGEIQRAIVDAWVARDLWRAEPWFTRNVKRGYHSLFFRWMVQDHHAREYFLSLVDPSEEEITQIGRAVLGLKSKMVKVILVTCEVEG